MAPTKKLFPRGSQLVSQGQKTKKQHDEEMPQVVRENLGDVDLDTKNDEEDLPKFPLNVTSKMIKPVDLTMVATRSVD